jgi:hypothetical protein
MYRIAFILFLVVFSCSSLQKTTYRIEESHYALYRQKALIVYRVKYNRVYFTNPTNSRCYFLKGRKVALKWQTGDTMIIDSNLIDFYNLRFTGKCM